MSAQPVSARDLGVEPEAETYRLHQLVDLVRAGRMRLPHFQRELKWGKEDVVALFDSIFRGPSSGQMKPKPFALLNHFTVPVAIHLRPQR